MMRTADISIVIPVRADTRELESLIERIRSWDIAPLEIVVISAGQDESLRQWCDASDCRYVGSISCRGVQLDAGAKAAEGSTIWFLHADAGPHAGSLTLIERTVTEGAIGGCFRFRLAGARTGWKMLVSRLTNLRVRLGGIPYGDQGLFVTREAYFAAGGFAPQPLFEEVSLVKRLRGSGHFRRLALPIAVDARRWEREGWIRRSLANRMLALRYTLGSSSEKLARRYEARTVTNRNDSRGSHS